MGPPREPGEAMSLFSRFTRYVGRSQLWRSVFRHGVPRDDRTRASAILGNVFLHLHPVTIRKSGIRLSYTWCMGGLTFFLFLVEVVTGILLMFYYRPTAEYAYADIQGLRSHVTLGILRDLQAFSWLRVYTALKPHRVPPNCSNASR